MSVWKRVGLAFISAALAGLIFTIVAVAADWKSSGTYGLGLFLIGESAFIGAGLVCVLPMIFFFDRYRGWQLWTQAVIGMLLGPVLMFAWLLFIWQTGLKENVQFRAEMLSFPLLFAACISAIATTLYLILARRVSHSASIQPTT